MEPVNLTALAAGLIDQAHAASAGRAHHQLHSSADHLLSQMLVGLIEGRGLSEHVNPGEATLQVLRGRVVLSVHSEAEGIVEAEAGEGQYVIIPPSRHALQALADSVVLLTVAMHDQPSA